MKVTMKLILRTLLLASLAAPAAAQCSLCPIGGDDLDRTVELFVVGESTCGDLEDFAAAVNEGVDCDATVESLNANFDISAVCCDSVDIIPTCSLCSGGTPLDPSTIPEFGDTTCGEYAAVIDAVVNQTLCLEFQTDIASACCEDLSNRCSICPEGSFLENQALGLPLSGDDWTCGFLDSQLGELPADSEMCATSRTELSTFFDIPSFCGCSGVTPTGGCTFCGPNALIIDPERQVGDFADDGFDDDKIFESPPTCGDFVTLAQFVLDPTSCGDITGLIPLCCEAAPADSEAAPVLSDPAPVLSDPAPACSICPEGSVLGHPTLGLPLSGDDFTCGVLDLRLGELLANSEMCATSRSKISNFFDIPAFCGCSGVTPSGGCSFCGPDDLVLNPEMQVGAFDDDGTDDDRIFESPPTCGDFVTLAPFVIAPTACVDISGLVPLCCKAGPAGSEAAPVDSEAAPADSEAAPAPSEAAPAPSEAAPAPSEAAPAPSEATPAPSEAAPTDSEAAPTDSEATPAMPQEEISY